MLEGLTGHWEATNRLWMQPGTPALESPTTASIALVAGGNLALIQYTWAEGGKPQDGLMAVVVGSKAATPRMTWVDSWHTAGQFMLLTDEPGDTAAVRVRGSYAAPPGPDWGWRIEIEAAHSESWQLRMFNITPAGQEAPAVLADYRRR